MMNGLEMVGLTKTQEVKLELKILTSSLGVMCMGKIRNKYIRGTVEAVEIVWTCTEEGIWTCQRGEKEGDHRESLLM